METTIYYAFSTIAQTLAAAIAFLGAFALYRLQVLDASLATLANVAPRGWERTGDVTAAIHEGRYEDQARLMREIKAPDVDTSLRSEKEIAQRSRFFRDVDRATNLKAQFTWAFGVTICTVVSSVAMIAVAPALEGHHWVSSFVLVIGLTLLAWCLVLQSNFVHKALETR